MCDTCRFLSTLLDPDSHIREYAEFCLLNVLTVCISVQLRDFDYHSFILKVRYPTLFHDSFIDCIWRFNEVEYPNEANARVTVEVERPTTAIDEQVARLFSLKGAFEKKFPWKGNVMSCRR